MKNKLLEELEKCLSKSFSYDDGNGPEYVIQHFQELVVPVLQKVNEDMSKKWKSNNYEKANGTNSSEF